MQKPTSDQVANTPCPPIIEITELIKIQEKNTIARPHMVEENIFKPCWRLVGESPAVTMKNPPIINISPARGPAIFHIRKSTTLWPSSNKWQVRHGVGLALVPHGTIDVTILKWARLVRGSKASQSEMAIFVIFILLLNF